MIDDFAVPPANWELAGQSLYIYVLDIPGMEHTVQLCAVYRWEEVLGSFVDGLSPKHQSVIQQVIQPALL